MRLIDIRCMERMFTLALLIYHPQLISKSLQTTWLCMAAGWYLQPGLAACVM